MVIVSVGIGLSVVNAVMVCVIVVCGGVTVTVVSAEQATNVNAKASNIATMTTDMILDFKN